LLFEGLFMNVTKTSESGLSFDVDIEPALLESYTGVKGLLSGMKMCHPLHWIPSNKNLSQTSSCELHLCLTYQFQVHYKACMFSVTRLLVN